MTYIPLSIYKVVDPKKLSSIAIGRRQDPNSPMFLFTGGVKPMIIHLTGDHAGCGFEVANLTSEPFLVIEDIEFEVDEESGYRPALVQEPVGAIQITDNSTSITVIRKNGGFDDAITVHFNDQQPGVSKPKFGEFGFKNWTAVKRIGARTIPVFSFESTKLADR